MVRHRLSNLAYWRHALSNGILSTYFSLENCFMNASVKSKLQTKIPVITTEQRGGHNSLTVSRNQSLDSFRYHAVVVSTHTDL